MAKKERRKHSRIARPLDATFQGATGNASCRVADIGWGGCFVQTLAEPDIGWRTVITPAIQGQTVDLSCAVVYRVRTMGFGVQFDPLSREQVHVLRLLLGEPPQGVGPLRSS